MALGWLSWPAWFRRQALGDGMALGDMDVHGWLWWHACFPVDAVVLAAVGVAGVALGDIDLHFAWQAWHLVTWTCTLRDMPGTYGTGLALVARLVPSGRHSRRSRWRGRRGTWRHGLAPCVAGVALGDMDLHFAWQVWHLVTCTCTLGGGRGTWRHPPTFCMAGVAPGDIDLGFGVAGLAGVALGDIHAASQSISLKYDFCTHNFFTHNL